MCAVEWRKLYGQDWMKGRIKKQYRSFPPRYCRKSLDWCSRVLFKLC